MRLGSRYFVATLVAGLAVLGLTACGDDSSDSGGGDDTIRIGLEAPLSGDQSTIGQGMLEGAQLAATQLNDDGGVLGQDVEIVPIDDAADPDTGVDAAEAAIDEGLDGVVGPYNSGVGIETLPLYVDAGLVPFRLTSDDMTQGLGYTLQPMSSQIAPVAADALTTWLGATSVAIAVDPTALYTRSIGESLQGLLEDAGVTVTTAEIEPGLDDYTDVVQQLASTNPDVIYASTYFPEGGLIARAMLDLGVSAQCVADYGSYDLGFIDVAGVPAAQACPVVGVPAPDEFPDAAQFVADYQDQFDTEPGTWSPYTYDSVMLLAQTAQEVGGFDADDLTAALDRVDDYVGWTGSIALEKGTGNREPATVVLLETTADGQFRIDPSWATAVGYDG
jgi:ABC-type branched-subunit amino acid transport system substrate-binding protein